MNEFKLDCTQIRTTARNGKIGVAKAERRSVEENDPMINKDADRFVTCQKCGTNKREYYASVEGVIMCGHCIYLKSKKELIHN